MSARLSSAQLRLVTLRRDALTQSEGMMQHTVQVANDELTLSLFGMRALLGIDD